MASDLLNKESAPPLENPAEYESVPSDCEICQHLMRGFHTPFAESYTAELGIANIVLYKPCATHDPLLAGLRERFEAGNEPFLAGYKLRTGRELTPEDPTVKIEKSANISYVNIQLSFDKFGGILECLELVKGPSDQHIGRGLILDPQWIDPNLLKKWMNCCEHNHGEDCEHPLKEYRLSEGVPGWLIDVKNRCLALGKPGMRYVTLSYKWGQTERPVLERALLAQYQIPKSLSGIQIPETIRNAMDIVELLGETYLWTDSLCITEDDEGAKFKALNEMAAIYANSILTIIAADGEDAQHGLRGIKGVSSPRNLISDRWIKFGDKEKVIKPRFTFGYYPQSSYFKRGWTFQEYLFSKRRLIFDQQMLRWECGRCKWSEDILHIDGPESRIKINWLDVVANRYPTLGAFGYMLLEYNHRQFKYEEDALPAITGLTSILSQKYEGGFLCGVPEMYFEAGLNWGPWSQDLIRRTSSGRSSASKSLTILPSWSWVGWEGRILGGWRTNQDYLKKGRFGSPEYTFPITEWFTSNDPSGLEKRRISSNFLWERDSYKDHLNRPLPPGWARHPHDPKTSPKKAETKNQGHAYEYPPPDRCGTCFYTHESVPDIEFWYPIPLLSPDTQPIIPPQTQYLFCSTHRAFLHVRTNESAAKPWDRHMWLRDEAGTWSGVLLLHGVADKETFNTETRVELVAISRGEIAGDEIGHAPMEITHEERPRNSPVYEFYNVLWVEWKEGVAYRKAHGRVVRDIWERQELESISLVLG